MIKRTLFFESPCHLNTKLNQLVVTRKGTGEINTIPIEDIGFVIVDNSEITFTQSVMQALTENNSAFVICNEKHIPSGLMLPLESNQLQAEKFRFQIDASEPLKKQLWQQTVKAKIMNQALMLESIGKSGQALKYHASQVKSDDSTNEEAQASRKYWGSLFDFIPDFTRERFGDYPNPFLNYGYAILRAAVARALIGSGLLPTLGIHHHNRYNAYPLADDIMEPYRPFVDAIVYRLTREQPEIKELNKDIKKSLLNLLTMDILISGNRSPLMVGLSQTTASLARCFAGENKKIIYPAFIID